jgi:hypothetical protein
MIKLRVDDFPGTKPEEFWRHNLDNFKRFDDVVHRFFVGYVLGVIPRHTKEEDLRWIGENSHIVPALHGVNHDESHPNEFGDHLTVDDVCKALLSAKCPIDDLVGPVDIYIPPHNVVDRKTCDALVRTGFKTLMAGPGSDRFVLDYAKKSGLYVQYSVEGLEYGRSDELLASGAHGTLRTWSSENVEPIWLTLHWTWERNLSDGHMYPHLEELFEKLFAL